jgi:uncharacterized membrane-anchored protein
VDRTRPELNKVPEVTVVFWIVKICATTLGETGGDAVSMTLGLGYLAATALFFAVFLAVAGGQVFARRYHPWLYWAVILATTTAGTTLSDFLDRSAHLGYLWGSVLLLTILAAILLAWRLALGHIVFQHVADRRVESFYWAAILVSNTLGTALGDYTSDEAGLGFVGGAVLFSGLIALVALAYFFTKTSRVLLFWAAFVLTRPLGATLGDTLTKPISHGGLNLGTFQSSAVLAIAVIALVALAARKPARQVDA